MHCTLCAPGWPRGDPRLEQNPGMWNEAMMDLLEQRHYLIASDVPDECCFWAASTELRASHEIRSTSWRETANITYSDLLEQAGAKRSSKDVHWPLTVSLRNKREPRSRRWRTEQGLQRRLEKTAKKGFGPLAQRPTDRSSGYGRSSGSGRARSPSERERSPARRSGQQWGRHWGRQWTQREWDEWWAAWRGWEEW